MRIVKTSKRTGFAIGLLASALMLLAMAPSALAAPAWRIDTLAPTTAAEGQTLRYVINLTNPGTEPTQATPGDPWKLKVTLPPGLEAKSFFDLTESPWSCPDLSAPSFTCENNSSSLPPLGNNAVVPIWLDVEVKAGSGTLTTKFSIEGGGATPTSTADPTRITPELPGFGIDAFDESTLADASGTPSTQAAGRPYALTTSVDLNTIPNPARLKGTPWPAEPAKDIVVELPPGALANTSTLPQCPLADLVAESTSPAVQCSESSQVGEMVLRMGLIAANFPGTIGTTVGPVPVFNMVPAAGEPARLGFNAYGVVVTIDTHVRSSGDYGVTASSNDISGGLPFAGSELTLWGVPASSAHDFARTCRGQVARWQGGPSPCPSSARETGFWRNPTSCEDEGSGLATTVRADSWFHPGDFDERTIHSHLPPGYALPESEWGGPQGPTGCSKVKFEPSLEATPTTDAADSPSGLDLHLRVPQDCWAETEGLCQSDLRDAEVTLPQGMTLNPAAASGIGSCTPQQVGLTTPVGQSSPIHFDEAKATCPDASKIGSVEIVSPLLGRHDPETGEPIMDADGNVVPEPLRGSVYLAQQVQNPFGSVLGMYLVAEGSGVVVKQAGEIRMGPGGRMTTVFKDAPQQPFSDLHVELFGGPRAPLRTPPSCGSFAIGARLTPWSGNGAVTRAAGFEPKLSAGTENPLAGATSPFSLRLSREDGTEELGSVRIALPPGLSGYLNGISYCPDAVLASISADLGAGAGEEASPSCPASSLVGTNVDGAGAGPNPFYTSAGRLYLAGPYKGAPVSLAVVTPAVAGPFDLGSVVVRNAVYVDPTSAQLTIVSDPFPTSLHGIPLDLRDVRVNVNRDHFTLNPTSCDEMQIDSTITSASGSTASPSERFQVGDCDRLGFKPRLALKLKGGTRRSKNPALVAVMRPRMGNANAKRIQVALPHSEFLAQDHIRTICTRVQFAADACPKGSIYGRVTATSPILDYPLSGNVYLRSSDNPLPDLVLALRGPAHQPIAIDAVGRIDSKDGGIRTTFSGLPDAPLTKVVLRMQGGEKSLLENSRNICKSVNRAEVQMDGQNGKIHDFRPALNVSCPGADHHRGR
jgi:hypothetical protein